MVNKSIVDAGVNAANSDAIVFVTIILVIVFCVLVGILVFIFARDDDDDASVDEWQRDFDDRMDRLRGAMASGGSSSSSNPNAYVASANGTYGGSVCFGSGASFQSARMRDPNDTMEEGK